ncbi:hypothetical protein LSTR_LSTR016341 [Laodelphax striatellus]|uniref:Uncharacterized protein n=1 Tax=Laodelphax striatellus TaxID=195883 RepID=A0A482X058_LAOST|nr:hypothetical protein LSTR_LSTR016341 [Laodelphax striatellus]
MFPICSQIPPVRTSSKSVVNRAPDGRGLPRASAPGCWPPPAGRPASGHLLPGRAGILTGCPFARRRAQCAFETELPYGLGSTNPRPTAVHMEPFPTSALQVLIEVFATTTKICTGGRSTRAHALGFVTDPRARLLLGASFLPRGRDVLTPFVGSDERPLRHLNLAFGSSRIASSAYQKWPTSVDAF